MLIVLVLGSIFTMDQKSKPVDWDLKIDFGLASIRNKTYLLYSARVAKVFQISDAHLSQLWHIDVRKKAEIDINYVILLGNNKQKKLRLAIQSIS